MCHFFSFFQFHFFSESDAVTLRPELENTFHHRQVFFNSRMFDGPIFHFTVVILKYSSVQRSSLYVLHFHKFHLNMASMNSKELLFCLYGYRRDSGK